MIRLKTEKQIEMIRQSGSILAHSLNHVQPFLQEGISTYELSEEIGSFIQSKGGIPSFLNYQGFPGAACVSVNEEIIHGIPKKNKIIKKGDAVSIDVGVNLDGYFSDRAQTFIIGDASKNVENLLKDTKISLEKAIDILKPGVRLKEIAKVITEYLEPKNYGIIYQYCGHGLGLAIHEPPQISHNYHHSYGSNPRLKKGMVLAIEPMVTLGSDETELGEDGWTVSSSDGSWAAHFEHTIVISDDGADILTLAL